MRSPPRATPRARCACSPSPTARAPPARPSSSSGSRRTPPAARPTRATPGHRVGLPLDLQLLLSARPPDRPYSRQEFAGALAANAAAKPFNLALLLIVVGGGLAVGAGLPVALIVGLLVYLAAATRTFFDADEADRVLAGGARSAARGSSGAARGSTREARAGDRRRLQEARRPRRASATRSSAPSCPTRRSPARSTRSSGSWSSPPAARSCCTRCWPRRRRSASPGGSPSCRAQARRS